MTYVERTTHYRVVKIFIRTLFVGYLVRIVLFKGTISRKVHPLDVRSPIPKKSLIVHFVLSMGNITINFIVINREQKVIFTFFWNFLYVSAWEIRPEKQGYPHKIFS